MIVIGTDPHKRTHTVEAANSATGELRGGLSAQAHTPGFAELLGFGRELDSERIWAIEDCRHVSGSFERYLVAHGERVVGVPPKLMGESRRGERTAGKSDAIDAAAIARAALKEGPETLPAPISTRKPCRTSSGSITARTSFALAQTISSACAGTCTTSGRAMRFPPVPFTGSFGLTGSPAGSPAPSRARAS